MGYDDDGFILPELKVTAHFVNVEYQPEDQLFFTHLKGIADRASVRHSTLDARLQELTSTINGTGEQWIVWTGLEEESRKVAAALDGAVEVKGSDDPEYKVRAFEDFQDGKSRIL